METMVHLLKSALGTGIFAIPNAFSRAGYIVGFISTIIIGSLATYCVHMIINMQYELCKKKRVSCGHHTHQRWRSVWNNLKIFLCSAQVPSMDYPSVGEAAILAGPKPLHKYAKVIG